MKIICDSLKNDKSLNKEMLDVIDYFLQMQKNDTLAIVPNDCKNSSKKFLAKFINPEILMDKKNICSLPKNDQKNIVLFLNPEKNRILERISIEEIGKLLNFLKNKNFSVGLAGKFEPPDVARFLGSPFDFLYLSQKDFSSSWKIIQAFKKSKRKKPFVFSKKIDRLLLRDLILSIKIGAYESEILQSQRICINIIADLNEENNQTEINDQIENVFSYDLLIDGVKFLVHSKQYSLLESLAQDIADLLLNYKIIRKVLIRIEKLDLGPKAIGLEIERSVF